ncbi:MAG: hypothetical protein KA352_17000 [Flavobacteriales bacterium]|nr:hypothetical protein [Flavobacteriales bacterium]
MGYRLTIALLVFIGLCKAHGQEFVQQHVPNDSITSGSPLVRALPNGDLWMTWCSWDTRINPWVSRLHVRKLDAAGQALAELNVRLPLVAPVFQLEGAAVLPDGGLALAGNFDWHGLYIRVDANGTLAAAKQYDFGYIDRLMDVAVLADGSPVLVGYYNDGTTYWGAVMRTDPDGQVIAALGHRFVGINSLHQKVRTTADGGLLVMGQDVAGNVFTDLHAVKMDSMGQVSWGRHFSGALLWPIEAVQHPDEGWTVLATQQVQDTIVSGAPVLISIAADGTVGSNTRLWAAPVESTFELAASMCTREDGGLLVCARVGALESNAMFTLDSNGTVSTLARTVPDSTFAQRMNGYALSGGSMLLYGERFSATMEEWAPLVARWDTANAFPCGSGMVPVVSDNITLGLDTAMEQSLPNPVVLDIMAQLLPDTIGWTVELLCDVGTSVLEPATRTGSLIAYPIPASDRLHVADLSGAEELFLMDVRGTTVQRWTRPFPAVLELSSVPDGLYLLRATTGAVVRSARVVVQR